MNQSPHLTGRSLLNFCTFFVLWFFNLAFVTGGLWFKSKQQDTTIYFGRTQQQKFEQRHSSNEQNSSPFFDTVLVFSCSLRQTLACVLFNFRVGHSFLIRNSKTQNSFIFRLRFRADTFLRFILFSSWTQF